MKDLLTSSHKLGAIFINRNFVLLWAGLSISTLGDVIYDLTLLIWIVAVIARQTNGQPAPWASLAVSGVLLAVALPSLLLGPIAGVFVDRWEKKQTMLWMDFTRLLLIALPLLAAGPPLLPWRPDPMLQLSTIYLTAFLMSASSQFFSPAQTALIGAIVEKKELGRASGLSQISGSVASMIGAPLAASVLFGFGVQWALLLNAFTFLISFLCIRAVEAPSDAKSSSEESSSEKKQGSFVADLLEGLHFSFKNSTLQVLLVVSLVVSLGAGAINALMIFFVLQNLHVPVSSIGWLTATFGAGVMIGATLMSTLLSKLAMTRIYTSAILSFGILFLLLARTSSFPVALSLVFLLGLTQALLSIAAVPIVLEAVPPTMIGRVVGTLNPLNEVAGLVSITLAGYLASNLLKNLHGSFLGFAIGPIDTIFTFSALLFLISGCYALIRLRSSVTSSSLDSGSSTSDL